MPRLMEAGMVTTRFTVLAIVALAWTLPVHAQPVDRAEMQAVITKADEELNKRYIFPDRAAGATAKIKAALDAGDYDAIADPKAFAERLTADLQSVTHDRHMRVFLAGAPLPPAPGAASPPKAYAGFLAVNRLKGNIGYINLQGFPAVAPFAVVADQAMADLAGTKALIIDMRGNGGGSPETVAYLCSFFFDPKTRVHINDLIYRYPGTETYRRDAFLTHPVPSSYLGKPVYLLTSARTFSGAEEFVYDLQTQKRAKLIGETTGGGANPGGGWPLNPRFGMFIPTGRAENPITLTNWEGTGVKPDVAVARDQALRVAMLEITRNRALKKEQAMEVDAFAPAHLLKFRDGAQPGAADALRQLLTSLALGEPDYATMSEVLAKATREQLPQLKSDLAAAGEIKTVSFLYIGPAGLDVYQVICANRTLQSGIFLTPDGKIATSWVRSAPPQ
jgi:hypothetical protein